MNAANSAGDWGSAVAPILRKRASSFRRLQRGDDFPVKSGNDRLRSLGGQSNAPPLGHLISRHGFCDSWIFGQ